MGVTFLWRLHMVLLWIYSVRPGSRNSVFRVSRHFAVGDLWKPRVTWADKLCVWEATNRTDCGSGNRGNDPSRRSTFTFSGCAKNEHESPSLVAPPPAAADKLMVPLPESSTPVMNGICSLLVTRGSLLAHCTDWSFWRKTRIKFSLERRVMLNTNLLCV